MAVHSNSDNLMSDINITPFVDVMLVLLIIFMVAAPMMTRGVKVDLPKVKTESMPASDDILIVTIDKKQQIYLNNSPLSFEFLKDKIESILSAREDKKVYLRADRAIPYGIVVKTMAEIKNAGVDAIGMVTEPEEQEKE